MEPTKEHHHEPLRSPDLIRVLDLLPSPDSSAEIRCTLRQVPLDDPQTKYEAVSYVWGASQGDQPIICDGQELHVTPNCLAALQHLRQRSRKRTLWIDAICINQKHDKISNEERNHQVHRMGQIYHQAFRVIVWLSIKGVSTLKAFRYTRTRRYREKLHNATAWLPAPGARLLELCYNRTPCSSDVLSYLALLRDPWFTRIWTIQEIAFARSSTVMHNGHEIPFHRLANALPVQVRDETTRVILFRFQIAELLNRIDGHLFTNKGPNVDGSMLSDLHVAIFRYLPHLQCSRPHDKIFGLYDVLQALGIPLNPPDYSKSITNLYQEAVVSFIRQHGTLEPLTATLPPAPSTCFPSWIPDWLPEWAPELPLITHLHISGVFAEVTRQFTSESCKKSKAIVVWDPRRSRLHLKAKRAGTICVRYGGRRSTLHLTWLEAFNAILRKWFYVHSDVLSSYSVRDLSSLFLLHEEESHMVMAWLHTLYHHDIEKAASIIGSPETQLPGYCTDLIREYSGRSTEFIKSDLERCSAKIQEKVDDTAYYAFITLGSGHLGRAHFTCRGGDEVWLLAGAKTPLVLRRQGKAFRVVAPALVVGMMEGQMWPEDERTLETICLI